jgi:NAD(P)-dependent dehydrogenase (short-subunit alcohol dehydrogenase family)
MPDPPVGNGQAISRLCAREGASVACADLVLERAQETVADVERLEDGRALAIAADASVEADVARMFDEAAAVLGGLDGLVCNVGIGRGARIAQTAVEDWDHVMAANLRSHFLCLKQALTRFEVGAAAVLISSVAGYRAGSQLVAYDASKAALAGLLRQATREGFARGVRVNTVVPGLIDTSLGRLATTMRPGRTSRLPFGRQGTAWEVASAALYLLSDEAAYVSGLEMFVDGGLRAM